MEVSALWKCPHYGSVRIMEVSALWKCPHYGSVRIMEVSALWKCPHYGSVRIMEVSALHNACPLCMACPLCRRVRFMEVFEIPLYNIFSCVFSEVKQ